MNNTKRLALQCGLGDYRGLVENMDELEAFRKACEADFVSRQKVIASVYLDNHSIKQLKWHCHHWTHELGENSKLFTLEVKP